jgi:hypothetical protein
MEEDLVLVAHTCSPSYSGGRDQEDHSLKLAQASSSGNPITKIWAGGMARGEAPMFKPQYLEKTKKMMEEED